MKLFRFLDRAFGILNHSLDTGHTLNMHSYWGRCSACDQTTPWMTNAWAGIYRCTHCGADQIQNEPRD